MEGKKSKNRWYVDPRAMKRYCFRTESDLKKFIKKSASARKIFRQRKIVVGKKKLTQIPIARACQEMKVVIIPSEEPKKQQLIEPPQTPQILSEPPPHSTQPSEPPTSSGRPPAPTGDVAQQLPALVSPAQDLIDLVNMRRRSRQLPELAIQTQLTTVAQAHVEDMEARSYFAASTLEGKTIVTRIDEAGYAYANLGMHIAYGYPDARKVFDGWVAGDGTLTIDDMQLNDIAVGYTARDPQTTYWVILFAESRAHRYTREFMRFEAALSNRGVILDELLQATNAARAACTPTSHPKPMPENGCPDQQLETECPQALAPLAMNQLLNAAAQGHADDMKARNFFDHVNLGGESIGARVKHVGYAGQQVGENLLCGNIAATPREAVEGWLQSCGHRKTLLSPSWTEVGFGLSIARGEHCGAETADEFAVYWVQNFGRPQ